MNVMYCGDAGIAQGVLLSVMSLLEQTDEQLDIFLLTAGIKTEAREFHPLESDYAAKLEALVRKRNDSNRVHLVDVSELFASDPPTANMKTRFTPCCMVRLYADLVPEIPDRILYLDYDVICRRNPRELYDLDLDDREFAGVLDCYGSWFFRRRPFKRDYVNSGVLMLNMAEIKRTGLFKKCRARCAAKRMFMPDQSALNKLSSSKMLVPRRFNEQRSLKQDTVIQHFSTSLHALPYPHVTSVKPWDIKGVHDVLDIHEYDALLEKFAQVWDEFEKISVEIC